MYRPNGFGLSWSLRTPGVPTRLYPDGPPEVTAKGFNLPLPAPTLPFPRSVPTIEDKGELDRTGPSRGPPRLRQVPDMHDTPGRPRGTPVDNWWDVGVCPRPQPPSEVWTLRSPLKDRVQTTGRSARRSSGSR